MAFRARRSVHLARCGQIHELRGFSPDATLLAWLREDVRDTAVKRSCGEGLCGSCSVALIQWHEAGPRVELRAACITLLGELDGAEVVTPSCGARWPQIDAIARQLREADAMPCGFCRSGQIMTAFVAQMRGREKGEPVAGMCEADGFSCPCGGRSAARDVIAELKRAGSACAVPVAPGLRQQDAPPAGLLIGDERSFFAEPVDEASFAHLFSEHPEAMILGGPSPLPPSPGDRDSARKIISPARIDGLNAVTREPSHIRFGAGVSLQRILDRSDCLAGDFSRLLARHAAPQIRNATSLGGMLLARGSGPLRATLLALDATFEARRGGITAMRGSDELLLPSGRVDLGSGEFIRTITLPIPGSGDRLFVHTAATGPEAGDQTLAIATSIVEGRIANVRVALASANVPARRLPQVEAVLVGLPATNETRCVEAVANIRATLEAFERGLSADSRDLLCRQAALALRRCSLHAAAVADDAGPGVELPSHGDAAFGLAETGAAFQEQAVSTDGRRFVAGAGPADIAPAFLDDWPEPRDCLHVALGLAPLALGALRALDLRAVTAMQGVVDVLTAADIVGANDISPGMAGVPLFAAARIDSHGQPLFAVIARSRNLADRAARAAALMCDLDGDGTTEDASVRAIDSPGPAGFRHPPLAGSDEVGLGGAMRFAAHSLRALETRSAMARRLPDGRIGLAVSGGNPEAILPVVARIAGLPQSAITCDAAPLGGAIDGEALGPVALAAIVVLALLKTGRPCKLHLDADEDFVLSSRWPSVALTWQVTLCADRRRPLADVAWRTGGHGSRGIDSEAIRLLSLPLPNAAALLRKPDEDPISDESPCRDGSVARVPECGARRANAVLLRAVLEGLLLESTEYLTGLDTVQALREAIVSSAGHRDSKAIGAACLSLDDMLLAARYRERQAACDDFNRRSTSLKRGIALTGGWPDCLISARAAAVGLHLVQYPDGSLCIGHNGLELRPRAISAIRDAVEAFLGPVSGNAIHFLPGSGTAVPGHTTPLQHLPDALLVAAARRALEQLGRVDTERAAEGPAVDGQRPRSVAAVLHGRAELLAGFAISEVEVETLTGEVRPRRIDLCFCSVSEAAGSEYRAAMAAGLDRGLDWILNEGLRFDGKGRLLSPDRQFCRSGADEPEIRFHFAADGRADRPDFDAGMLAAQASQLAASAYFAIRNALRACAAAERATGLPSTFRLDLPATPPAIRRALAEPGA